MMMLCIVVYGLDFSFEVVIVFMVVGVWFVMGFLIG